MENQSKTAVAARRQALEMRLAALTERLTVIETELLSHHDPDWAELAVEREGDEVLESIGLGAQEEIRAIRAALQRIEAGTYGICQRCGAGISAARLDVLPAAALCRECAI